MLLGLYIVVDDEIDDPVYAEPPKGEQDEAIWAKLGEIVNDLRDGEIEPRGSVKVGEAIVAWRSLVKTGLIFLAAVSDDVKPQLVEVFLQKVAKKYVDEVDDWRSPDRGGVSEVVVDVIPPWEAEDDD
jgi:hypothetical protein